MCIIKYFMAQHIITPVEVQMCYTDESLMSHLGSRRSIKLQNISSFSRERSDKLVPNRCWLQ